MKLAEFTEKMHDGAVDEIVIEAMEGDIYLVRPSVEGESEVLLSEDGSLLRQRSLNAAKTLLRDMGVTRDMPLFFRHSVAHDEMMGSGASTADDRMPITLEGEAL
ncbi:DUF6482 family protein [Kushneria aurantia]|uniref:DUF6482 family protein n=1 Tax=Kushneria aurantia TaxID=504092 RepID=A0ABV6G318_9GAMM|nr:DUF6482 family protein [Kushneria aurantia]